MITNPTALVTIIGGLLVLLALFALALHEVIVQARQARQAEAEAEDARRAYSILVAQQTRDMRQGGAGIVWWQDAAEAIRRREESYARSVAGWWKN